MEKAQEKKLDDKLAGKMLLKFIGEYTLIMALGGAAVYALTKIFG